MQGINAEPLTIEVSLAFLTLFLLYNDGKLGKSADSGANIIRISHGDVSTFLVHQLVSLCPPVGLLVPVTRASAAHHVGIGRPCAGQLLPIAWATSAQISDSFLGNIL